MPLDIDKISLDINKIINRCFDCLHRHSCGYDAHGDPYVECDISGTVRKYLLDDKTAAAVAVCKFYDKNNIFKNNAGKSGQSLLFDIEDIPHDKL